MRTAQKNASVFNAASAINYENGDGPPDARSAEAATGSGVRADRLQRIRPGRVGSNTMRR